MDIFDFNYLQVVNEDLSSWCEKYNLSKKETNCFSCDARIVADIPAFGKEWRGLVTGRCSCGTQNNFRHFVLTADANVPVLLKMLG